MDLFALSHELCGLRSRFAGFGFDELAFGLVRRCPHQPALLPAHIINKYLISMPDIKLFPANDRMGPVHSGSA